MKKDRNNYIDQDLFPGKTHIEKDEKDERKPLAERMRPRNIEEILGQGDVLCKNSFLRIAIEKDQVPSIILWGPPGSGKTSIASVIANSTKANFISLSGVFSGVKEVREVLHQAELLWRHEAKRTILFIDEIHRFSKSQQDGLLPHVENGAITLIGATTENPFFEVISPLLSRCRVIRLKSLDVDTLVEIGRRALLDNERGLGHLQIKVEKQILYKMANNADHDARRMLNLLEASILMAVAKGVFEVTDEILEKVLSSPSIRYDRAYEEHYNVISAFIKSLRGSDPDAALYYLARMLEGGEDPRFICRRMIIFAAEDIGNADPMALVVAVATQQALEFVGMPEAKIPMAQAVVYLATCPKSNSSYMALNKAIEAVHAFGSLEIPFHLRNAPVVGMTEFGYGQGYKYPHDFPDHYVEEIYLPEAIANLRFFEPTEQGFEKQIRERLSKKSKS